MVTIEVGAEKEHFVVHQSFLCVKSPYFDKTLSGSFQEAITRFIHLPDTSPILFRIFVAWIYHGDLGYVPRNGRTIDEDLESLKITEEDVQSKKLYQSKFLGESNDYTESIHSDDTSSDEAITQATPGIVMANASEHHTSPIAEPIDKSRSASKPKYQGDDPSNWPCDILVNLYVVADRFDIRELRADSLDALIDSNTTAESPLRKFAVNRLAFLAQHGTVRQEIWLDLPHKMVVTALLQKCRIMSSTLREGGKFAAGHPNKDEDLKLSMGSICNYHEHADSAERKACRARRNQIASRSA
jgi:hypothetical protein